MSGSQGTALSRAPSTAEPGARIGHRYQILERLGRGGTAIVYRVRDVRSGDELALKQLVLRGSSNDREMRLQFEREFYVLSQLSHPSVIAVHDFGIDVAGPYYTMELLDGGDLSARAPLPYRSVCELAVQICSSLSLLHSRRLVHRDVSPRNVRCTREGSAKLIDFGAMVPMGPSEQVVGTPSFVAPEVVYHLALDARTDLFSLGATLYFALTGKKPFAARELADLNDAWREPPPPPSQFVPAIPAALDALVLSLLRIDPARRPRSAFEVIVRLTAIAGITQAEPEQIARAYLETPAIVGRDREQRRFRQRLHAALQCDGGSLFLEGEPGAGRTRLLDACVLEAKIAGASVLRVDGRAAAHVPLAGAHALAEQLVEQLPELAVSSARALGVHDDLLSQPSAAQGPRILPLSSFAANRARVQDALTSWLYAVCEQRPLVLALDDIERVDDASLGWIAAWLHAGSNLRALIVATLPSSYDTSPRLALHTLRDNALRLSLAPLTGSETELLFASMFSDAPNVALVSQRIQRIANGNLRESMALVRHLLARRVIRYAEGSWILPAELALSELPASAEDAVRTRIAALPSLALCIARTQALAFEGPWTRDDYAWIAGAEHAAEIEEALAMLVREGVLVDNGRVYTLSHLGMRACLVAEMSEVEQAERHLALAELCARSARPDIVEVHHCLLAGATDRALDRLITLLDGLIGTVGTLYENVERTVVLSILERAKVQAGACGRPARDVHVINQRLIELSLTTREAVYHAHAPGWLAQLELDSGLCDYRRTNPELSRAQRLQQALEQSAARYAATPARDRVYDQPEAVNMLAHLVAMSFTIALRASDSRIFEAMPAKLEPFADASPRLAAYAQYMLALPHVYWAARPERGLPRLVEAYALLEPLADVKPIDLKAFCSTIASTAAVAAIMSGDPSAELWIEKMELHPLQQLRGLNLRRMLCVFDGDASGAERYRKQAELLAIRNDGRGLAPVLSLELAAHLHAGDLAGVKHVADRIEQLASKASGWRALHQLAQASFERLRGDPRAALAAATAALDASDPTRTGAPRQVNVWVAAAAEYVAILTELGRVAEARAAGEALLRQCEALQITGQAAGLQRALALAQAQLGDHAGAAARLDALIGERAPLRASLLAPDYEARVRVAIAAKDSVDAERFGRLARKNRSGTGFEAVVLGAEGRAALITADAERVANLERLPDAAARAGFVLELLVTAAGARGGYLYYHPQAGTLERAAALDVAPDPELDRFANGYFQQESERAGMTTIFTEADAAGASWTNSHGAVYRVALLQTKDVAYVGVVVLCGMANPALPAQYRSLSKALSDRLLQLRDCVEAQTG